MLEQIKSPLALHELNRRKRKGEIEKENFRVAHKLYSTKAALAEKFNFKKDYDFHLKVKTLRCKFPVIDMKQNRFNPGFELARPAQSTKNALGPSDLVKDFEASLSDANRKSPESPRILNKILNKRAQRLHYNSIDVTAHTAAGDSTARKIEEENEGEFDLNTDGDISKENI